jgi:hypothetical protein
MLTHYALKGHREAPSQKARQAALDGRVFGRLLLSIRKFAVFSGPAAKATQSLGFSVNCHTAFIVFCKFSADSE